MRVLITGATGNVGRACLKQFDFPTCEVVALSRNGGEMVKAVDLGYTFEIEDWLAGGEDSFDLVIMAHGTQQAIELKDRGFKDVYHDVVNNNLTSAVYLTHQLALNNKLNEGSLIIYCSSIQATQPRAGRGPYAVAKAGLEALTKIAAVELAPKVRVIGLRLGQLTKTMNNLVFSEEQRQSIEERTPLMWVDSDDVARICLDLYEQKSMTGCVLDIDSGHRLNIWP